jgi:hypothetical protein
MGNRVSWAEWRDWMTPGCGRCSSPQNAVLGETADIFLPMLIFLIASLGKKNSAVPGSEDSPCVTATWGKHERWTHGGLCHAASILTENWANKRIANSKLVLYFSRLVFVKGKKVKCWMFGNRALEWYWNVFNRRLAQLLRFWEAPASNSDPFRPSTRIFSGS